MAGIRDTVEGDAGDGALGGGANQLEWASVELVRYSHPEER
jgi:hypothetical protein